MKCECSYDFLLHFPFYSIEKMEKANSKFRIGLMFGMMAFSLIGSAYAVMLGKRDVREHMTIAKKNSERYRNAEKKQ